MNQTSAETLSVVVERDIPHPPEKIWRALTLPHLIEEWLMKNDFKPVVGHRFDLRADWGAVDCEVVTVEPNKALSYTWNVARDDMAGLTSVVTWTLTRPAPGRICAWSSRASGRISRAISRAPSTGGRSSLPASSRSWRASIELCSRVFLLPSSRQVRRSSGSPDPLPFVPRRRSSLNWNTWIRQTHRWLSIIFTLTVIANFVAMSVGQPPAWVVYAPLPPLALMLFTGLYMYALPYVAGGRGGRTQEKRA